MNSELKAHFLPTSQKEMQERGWNRADIILFTGDAYVDHPAFGVAIIARVLEREGYRVAVVPQPNWRDDLRDFKKLGIPRLFFGVTAGNMDSMVNHYTANKRLRSDDAYTPGDKAGQRPDYAVVVYSQILKSLYPSVPVVLGGIEASLRRLTHYDYWSDTLKPSVLLTSQADLLVYGMGEKPIVEIAKRLDRGEKIDTITNVPQTVYRSSVAPSDAMCLASFEECLKDPKIFAQNFVCIEEESNKLFPKTIAEPVGSEWVVVNPPYPPLTQEEMDAVYDLPFTRLPHPRYWKKPSIPAYEMIKDSVTIHRGCFGGCSFCTISAHQGKFVSSRSQDSVLREIQRIAEMPTFKGHITDLGGPSANMYMVSGKNMEICARCKRASCIFPSTCKNLENDPSELVMLYRAASRIEGVRKITIGSGIRYDMLLNEEGEFRSAAAAEYFKELVLHHVSGRLKVAPEHTSEKVLRRIRKPSFTVFRQFHKKFTTICKQHGLKYQLIPYFISSLPGCTLEDMADLAHNARELKLYTEQVQDFTPTPMTLASVLYYAQFDPFTKEKLEVAKTVAEKKVQQLFFFLHKPEKRQELKKALLARHRSDLVTFLGLK